MKCVQGGIKEACIIVREYLQNSRIYQTVISSSNSAVTTDEFVQAVKVLMAYSWQNRANDCIPERWECDIDCASIDSSIFCPGEFQIASKDEKGRSLSKTLCPYFRDSGNI